MKELSKYESPVTWWMLFLSLFTPGICMVLVAVLIFTLPIPIIWCLLLALAIVMFFLMMINYYMYRIGGCESIAYDYRGELLVIQRRRRFWGRRKEIMLRDISKVEISEKLQKRHTDYNPQGMVMITLHNGRHISYGKGLNLGESRKLVQAIEDLRH